MRGGLAPKRPGACTVAGVSYPDCLEIVARSDISPFACPPFAISYYSLFILCTVVGSIAVPSSSSFTPKLSPMTSVRTRPTLWSNLSFQKTKRHDRSSSISSQLRPNDQALPRPARFNEPGDLPSKMSSRWTKTIAVVVLFCVALFFLGPKDGYIAGINRLTDHSQHFLTEQVDRRPASSAGQAASDPLYGTTKCTKSSSKNKPIVQYVVMVDAGSTGSRVHVYRFNNCAETPELEHEDFLMIKGGLSSYAEDAEGAAKSLDPLLEVALKSVPDKLKSCTPIAVKATAGLRMLKGDLGANIIEAVKHRLETKYPFPIVEKGVSIMEGSDEGNFSVQTFHRQS